MTPDQAHPDQNAHLAEWKEARGIVDSLDGTISGLRKYGFTFITALLAADSILGQATSSASYTISDPVKFAVMGSTLVLICALYSTDRFYRVIQTGAAHDAEWVEHRLKMRLTYVIAQAYKAQGARYFVELIYGLFALATAVLGYLILQPSWLAWAVVVSSILAVVFIGVMEWWAARAEARGYAATDLMAIRAEYEAKERRAA